MATTAKGESYRERGQNIRYAWVMAQWGGYRALTMGAIGGPVRLMIFDLRAGTSWDERITTHTVTHEGHTIHVVGC